MDEFTSIYTVYLKDFPTWLNVRVVSLTSPCTGVSERSKLIHIVYKSERQG